MHNGKAKKVSIRSSAAEYLTYVSAIGDSANSIEMRYEDENIWLTQKMMSVLYGVDVRTINDHIQKIFKDNELEESSTIRNFRIVQNEGNREVARDTKHYNLQAIIAVGFKINNERAVQFRKWANGIVKDYTIQGWVMDEERLKNGGSVLTKDYFEKQLQKIREIRMSERRFYQKVTDIYATSLDYDALIEDVRRLIRSSIGNRAKESLIVEFINESNLDDIEDKAGIIHAFFTYAQKRQAEEIETLIEEEKLNIDAAKRYISTSLRKEYASENGTELNEILPKMSPLNPSYLTKKHTVFQKISEFVNKFKGIGGMN